MDIYIQVYLSINIYILHRLPSKSYSIYYDNRINQSLRFNHNIFLELKVYHDTV